MLLLASTEKIQVVTTTANACHMYAAYADIDADGAVTYGNAHAIVSSAATTDLVAAPAAGSTRNVRTIVVHAQGGANAPTIQHYDGSTAFELVDAILAADEQINYDEAAGFRVLDATGAQKIVQSGTGRWLKTTVLTSGTSFATGPQTTSIFVRLVGGGGGGGGCTSVSSAASAAGGGGAGGYAEKTFAVAPSTNYTYAVGAAGNGASGAAGGNGTASTFAVGATTVTANGGQGAVVATAATTLTAYKGGLGGAVSTNGDMNGGGASGEMGVCLIVATPIVSSGHGASGPFGGGGQGITAVGNGVAATGYGAGGGGAATGAAAVRTGGNGTGGIIIVDEYA